MNSRIDCKFFQVCALLLPFLFCSCLSQKEITYFQQKADTTEAVPYDTLFITTIHPNDIINVFVTSVNAEASKYFNFADRPDNAAVSLPGTPGANGYIVDAYGYVQLPLVGSVLVAGLTSREARDTITKRLERYIQTPSVKLNIQNFRVTILGEVSRPGVYYVSSEKMEITSALAMAGDLTIFAKRDNISVIREENGKKTFATIDLTSRDLFNSPYYNLHSNDILYVEPLKSKKFQAQNWYRVMPFVLSSISVAIVLVRLYQ
jgi:polysaccharide export outer membrane protein